MNKVYKEILYWIIKMLIDKVLTYQIQVENLKNYSYVFIKVRIILRFNKVAIRRLS